jgi:hypothetical protein
MSAAPQPGRGLGSGRPAGSLERFTALAGGEAVLIMTARFGRSAVRDAAYRFRAKHRDLDLKLSWQLFSSLADWAKCWPAEQHIFTAGLILSAAGDPVVERAVGRCCGDLAQLGRAVLWGVVSGQRIRWRPRFSLTSTGWSPWTFPYPDAAYARLGVARDAGEFQPRFDPILYSAEPDFFISGSRLLWHPAVSFFDVVKPGAEADHG